MDRSINDIFCASQSYNLSVVAFSLPNEADFTIYIHDSLTDEKIIPNKEFWIAPFHSSTGFPLVKLKPTHIIQGDEAIPNFKKYLNENKFWTIDNSSLERFTEQRYIRAVEDLQQFIQEGKLKKAAIAQIQQFNMPQDFNFVDFLLQLRSAYPNAFISYISTPFTGTWIGATPELLLSKQNNELKTVALAGTIVDDGLAQWTEKEKVEQDFVSQHVTEVLLSLNLGELFVSELKEIRIGNLVHLIKEFVLKSNSELHADAVENVAFALHPTPAVGGLPKLPSIEYIQQVENYNRSYYAGFLGPVDTDNAKLFVNLRCMTLINQIIYFFGGAGITADSIAANEWIETNNKINLIQRFIAS